MSVQAHWTFQLNPTLKKGPFSAKEDDQIQKMYEQSLADMGRPIWIKIASQIGRDGQNVRLHWENVINPALRKGRWTPEEDPLVGSPSRNLAKLARSLSRSPTALRNRRKVLLDAKVAESPPGTDSRSG
ncbi:hypothetical protein HKX48_004782 [Thoreauomyces humboldtii]|nr:hypothetical protein HKX48_004782 [Thoreauomyces humboldtii]